MATTDDSEISLNEIGNMCSYAEVEQNGNVYILSENTKVNQLINQITHFIGAPPNFEVRAATVGNALAIIPDKGKYKDMRMILYNPKFFLDVEENTRTDWATISVLCHEIGHHMLWHTVSKANTYRTELDADKYSGWLMRNLGASKEQSIRVMYKMGSDSDGNTHPNKDARMAAILAGWEEADFNINEGAKMFASRISDERPQQITLEALETRLIENANYTTDSLPAPLPMPVPVPVHVQVPVPSPPQSAMAKPAPYLATTQINLPRSSAQNAIPHPISTPVKKNIFGIPLKFVASELEAKILNANYLKEGIRAEYISTAQYPSLRNKGAYLVYIGPFLSQYSCEIAVENYKKQHPATYGMLLNSTSENIVIHGLGNILSTKK